MILNHKMFAKLYSKSILKEINHYDMWAKEAHQGCLNTTWIKYVLHLNSAQWGEIKAGSSAISLDTYKKTLSRIKDSEKKVFGSIKSSSSEDTENNFSKGKNQGQKQQLLDRSKNNLNKILNIDSHHYSHNIITAIAVQKHHKHRFNVFIDHKYAFPVGADVLIQYHLNKGKHISKSLKEKISDSDNVSKLYNYSINLLVHNAKTEYEMKERLYRRTSATKAINLTLQKLKQVGLINDKKYASEYVIDQSELNDKGPMFIKNKLLLKHVDPSYINLALEKHYPRKRLIQNGLKIAKNKFKFSHNTSFSKSIRKVKATLLRRGYKYDQIQQIMDIADFHPNHELQHQLLIKKTKGAQRRYSSCTDKFKRKMKIKAYLLRQGFSFDEITTALNDLK